MAIVNALMSEIGPISASERLEGIADVAVATGSAKKDAASRHQRRLSRLIKSDSKPATKADLSLLGIVVDG